jgi:eukaryotic-like serine/threonine-protein kinase
MPLRSIGHYEVLELIGEGGMGTVYRALDPRFDRPVAVKVLHEQLRRDLQVVTRFKAEAVIQAKLNHPGIISVYDFVEEPECIGMIMEFVDGVPLNQMIVRERRIPVGRCFSIVSQLLDAIAWAHAQGLIHRDIKPSNVIVRHAQGKDLVKVGDFGVAKVVGSDKMMTATGAKMGTLAYMSPEQFVRPRDVDARTDIYAIGITLYEMLTGAVPFQGDTDYELMQRIVNEEPPAVSGHIDAPPDLDELVARAIAKDRDERYGSCEEFQEALDGAAGGFMNPHGVVAARSSAWVTEETPSRVQPEDAGSNAAADPDLLHVDEAEAPDLAKGEMVTPDVSVWSNPWLVAPLVLLIAFVVIVGLMALGL